MHYKTNKIMIIETDILTKKFRKFNEKYFNKELPLPKITLLHSYRYLGYFLCDKVIGRRRLKHQEIQISDYYDWDEKELDNIIIHEMIHYYLAYKHIDNDLTHGKAFQEMANKFNKEYGFNIKEKIDTTKFKRQKNAPKLGWFIAHYLW